MEHTPKPLPKGHEGIPFILGERVIAWGVRYRGVARDFLGKKVTGRSIQWLFLVPLKGGRWHIIPQLAVYTTYIPLIYCLLGGYMLPTFGFHPFPTKSAWNFGGRRFLSPPQRPTKIQDDYDINDVATKVEVRDFFEKKQPSWFLHGNLRCPPPKLPPQEIRPY